MLVTTVSTQRSGTKMLSNCFSSGTAVSPFGEVFNPDILQCGSFRLFMESRGMGLLDKGLYGLLDQYFDSLLHIRSIPAIDIMFNQLEIPTVTWNPSPHAGIYGYLLARNAVVISLERDLFDSFVSMKYLKISGVRAHRASASDSMVVDVGPVSLSEQELALYIDGCTWHRQALERAMTGYDRFYRLSYDTLAQEQGIPAGLRSLIARSAEKSGHTVAEEWIQIHATQALPSDVDYSTVFANYAELRDSCRSRCV